MKTRKYLRVIVRTNDNNIFFNPLKLSEANLVSPLAQYNKELIISIRTISNKEYKLLFG